MNSFESPLQPPLKKHKTSEEGSCVDVDRISQLPDGVICHILSFVTPTKYSIRTCVLSKRWQHLWPFSLKFDLMLHPGKISEVDRYLCADSFVRLVDNLFFLRDCLNMETFKLYVPMISPERPSSWISAIVMCNIRELDMQVGCSGQFDLVELPWCLFTCKTLAVLKLSGSFILDVPHSVCLPNLKTLRFESITYLDDAVLPKLLSGCPLIEDLQIVIYGWDPIWALTIYHSSLKRLCLHCPRGRNQEMTDRYKIIVDAPNLEFIDLRVDLFDTLLKPLPNIDEGKVNFPNFVRVFDTSTSTNKMQALFESMVKVRRLFLSEETLNLHVLPIFCNLVQLEISCTHTVIPCVIMDMLCHSPTLEALCLRFMGICFDVVLGDIELENNHEDVPGCLRHSLKTVKIHEFVGTDSELIIIKYLLENAVVLQKMAFSWRVPSMEIDSNLRRKLTNSSRLSPDCQLVFLSGKS